MPSIFPVSSRASLVSQALKAVDDELNARAPESDLSARARNVAAIKVLAELAPKAIEERYDRILQSGSTPLVESTLRTLPQVFGETEALKRYEELIAEIRGGVSELSIYSVAVALSAAPTMAIAKCFAGILSDSPWMLERFDSPRNRKFGPGVYDAIAAAGEPASGDVAGQLLRRWADDALLRRPRANQADSDREARRQSRQDRLTQVLSTPRRDLINNVVDMVNADRYDPYQLLFDYLDMVKQSNDEGLRESVIPIVERITCPRGLSSEIDEATRDKASTDALARVGRFVAWTERALPGAVEGLPVKSAIVSLMKGQLTQTDERRKQTALEVLQTLDPAFARQASADAVAAYFTDSGNWNQSFPDGTPVLQHPPIYIRLGLQSMLDSWRPEYQQMLVDGNRKMIETTGGRLDLVYDLSQMSGSQTVLSAIGRDESIPIENRLKAFEAAATVIERSLRPEATNLFAA